MHLNFLLISKLKTKIQSYLQCKLKKVWILKKNNIHYIDFYKDQYIMIQNIPSFFIGFFIYYISNIFLYRINFINLLFLDKYMYNNLFRKTITRFSSFYFCNLSELHINRLVISNLTTHYNFLFKNIVYGLLRNKVIIICNRKQQNIFFTLTNWKGDVLYTLSFGHFFSDYSSKLRPFLSKKKRKLMSYKARKKFFKDRKNLTKVISKWKNKIKFKHLRDMVHNFCNVFIELIGSNPYRSRIVLIDVVFIQFESDYKHVINILFKRLRFLKKNTFLSNNKLKYYITRQSKYLHSLVKYIVNEVISLIDFYKKNKKIFKSLKHNMYKVFFIYYVLILYYFRIQKKFKTYFLINRYYFLNLIKFKKKYLFY